MPRITVGTWLCCLVGGLVAEAVAPSMVAADWCEPVIIRRIPYAAYPPIMRPEPIGRMPNRRSREFAVPSPAPPSPEPAPPPGNKPRVIESRSLYQGSNPGKNSDAAYDIYATSDTASPNSPTPDRHSVAFWNLTPRAVSLRVNGSSHTLARGQSVTLDLPKKFLWQTGNRDPVTTDLSPEKRAVEIVLRR